MSEGGVFKGGLSVSVSGEKKFPKRLYEGFGRFWDDFTFVWANRSRVRRSEREGRIDPAFRERLMLAVTGVNDCRFCSYRHSRKALEEGVGQREIDLLLEGKISVCPEDEVPAVMYARHWAETGGRPDAKTKQRLQEIYGEKTRHDLHLILRMIRMANLLGNAVDYILFRLSGGRWGVQKANRDEK